jgi:propanol-preferring alcohol dehydrogenase
MHAMVLTVPGAPPQFAQRNDPTPGFGAVRVKVSACGVCRTDLHIVDGELPGINYPIVPGHEVVGRVDALGPGVTTVKIGERVGVPWLGYTCCDQTHMTLFPLREANDVLSKLRSGQITGAAVLHP